MSLLVGYYYFGMGIGGGTDPEPDLPDSLLGAIKAYWTASGLVTSIGPLYAEGAPSSKALPFVVVDGIREMLPGPTPDDTPVEMFLTVWDRTASGARASARLVQDHFGDPGVVPAAVERDQLAWDGGYEKFVESDGSAPDITPKPYLEARAYRFRLHFRWWISGRS